MNLGGFQSHCRRWWVLLIACALPAMAEAQTDRTMTAIVGGFLVDGYGGDPLEQSVILMDRARIVHVGTLADTDIPPGARVVDAHGYTVMPGLHDMHVHLMILGHGIYDTFFPSYRDRLQEVMLISARQLLMRGVTSARDLGAPLELSIRVKEEIESGRAPGPRMFVSGPFLQKSLPIGRYDSSIQDFFRWTVGGAGDAREKAQQLADAGVDVLKVIQVCEMTPDERAAIGEVAHARGLHIAIHAGTYCEVEAGIEMGAATIEHVGGGRRPRREADTFRLMADYGVAYVPTTFHSRAAELTLDEPARLDNRRLREDLPADLYEDVRESLDHFTRLTYFRPGTLHDHETKVMQAFDAGVRILVGTDSGTPMNFHYESTWREMDLLVQYGMPSIQVIAGATRWPAVIHGMQDDLGTISPGKIADIIVVDGNPLDDMSALRNIVHVFKGGTQYK